MIQKWDNRFLNLAEHFSTWSKDPSRQIGSLAVSNTRQILSIGWNGFPRGVEDWNNRLNDRELKYKFIVHAEQNVLYNACQNGISLIGSTLYTFGLPVCGECAKGVIQCGIKEVKCGFLGEGFDPRWKESCIFAQKMFEEAQVEYTYFNRIDGEWKEWDQH